MTSNNKQTQKYASHILHRGIHIISIAICAASLSSILLLCICICFRFFYPHLLGWYEDEHLYQVTRILVGQRLYEAPSLSYVAHVYGPFFYYTAAILSFLFGTTFTTLRFISVLSTIGTLYLIYRFTLKETRDKKAALVAAGVYAAAYPLTRYSFDIGRVDSFFLFLLMGGLFLTRFGTSAKMHMLSAMGLVLASFTKQAAIFMFGVFVLYYLYFSKKYRAIFIGTGVTLFALIYAYMNKTTDGWYSYYTFSLVTTHTIRPIYGLAFWVEDMMKPFPIIFIGEMYILYYFLRYRFSQQVVLLSGFISLMGIAFFSRIRDGGDINILMPAYGVLAIFFGHFCHYLFSQAKDKPSLQKSFTALYILFFVMLQIFFLLFYRLPIPGKTDRKNTQRLYNEVKKISGDVFMISHRNILETLHKKRYAHLHTLNELFGYYGDKKPNKEGALLLKEMKKKIAVKSFGAIILDQHAAHQKHLNPFLSDINRYYFASNRITFPVEEHIYFIYKPRK